MSVTALAVTLGRPSRIYDLSEPVTGSVDLTSRGSAKCGGLRVTLKGTVGGKQRSLTVLSAVLQLPCPTPLPAGLSRVPFAFPLTGDEAQSYEGHQFAVRYSITAEVLESATWFGKDWTAESPLWLRSTALCRRPVTMPVQFRMQEDGLRPKRILSTAAFETLLRELGEFLVLGAIDSGELCAAGQFRGTFVVQKCSAVIDSMELQLCQLEIAPDATGAPVQSAMVVAVNEVVHGDPCRGLELAFLMQIPFITCCPTFKMADFSVDWEVHFVIYFRSHPPVYEKFPLRIVPHSHRCTAPPPPTARTPLDTATPR
jgi:hypothetical protein